MKPDVPSAAGVSESQALATAGRAVALCCRGAIEEGLVLYKDALRAKNEHDVRHKLPVALHLRLLRDATLNDVAAVVSREAVAAGYNVSIAAALDKAPADIAAEYRALFADGTVNAAMVADYLVQLHELGETKELQTFVDVERVIQRTVVAPADAETSAESYWRALADWLLAQCTAANWHGDVQSVRDMHHIALSRRAGPRIEALLALLRTHVARYLAELRSGIPRIQAWIPDQFRLNAWALVSTGAGYNVPHIHPKGCATGVLYVTGPEATVPDGAPVGALRIGAPPGLDDPAGWPDIAVAPQPGTLVLMPSYLTHWTTPLGKPGLRISIAFDVIDSRAF